MVRTIFSALLIWGILTSYGQAQNQNPDIWSLRRCLEHAKENNIDLQVSKNNLHISKATLTQAKTSRLPDFSFGVNGSANFGYSINQFTNQFDNNTQGVNMGAFTSVPVYQGGRINNTIRQAQVDLRASQLDLEQAEYDLGLNITLAYLNILRNAEFVESARLQVVSTKEQRDRTEKLVKAGSLAQADLIQLESQIATDELAMVNAQNQLEVSYLSLQQLLRLDPDERFGIEKPVLDDPSEVFTPGRLSDIYKTAEASQPFIQSADLGVRSAELGRKIAHAGERPSLTLNGQLVTGYSNPRDRFTGDFVRGADTSVIEVGPSVGELQKVTIVSPTGEPVFENYPFLDQLSDNIRTSISLGINVPIYSRGVNKGNVQRAELRRLNAKLNADLQRQVLKQTIQQAYVDAKSAHSTYLSTMKQINALELTFRNTEKQFNIGISNSVDYLLAKNNLDRARFDLVRAKFDYIFRMKVLDFYQGKPIGF